ncbi:MAG: ABC transporter ATP-binding protein [Bacteroidales bacterium]|nr:ABC transporter ATP-binding protein [Bacteroidales bacterium]
MSNDVVIKVQNLSKRYRIGAREGYKTFRETLVDSIKAPFRRIANIGKPVPEAEIIWALKDVSFEVKKGEVLGIIGRNGAGKTTLLKILSRITEPTEGRIELKGKVGSLLEVGTGFHPELTGHENIYLYGAILGMDRYEITRKFDEIVAFAEIEKFIDTPVKRYSSGMYMRLAFAVAAHMETEILLVDEVLAVGDAEFQKKCLGKMDDVAREGRTVLFVSHNMGTIENICGWGILLESGKIISKGDIHSVVSDYLSDDFSSGHKSLQNCKRLGNGKIQIINSHLESSDGEVIQVAKSGEPVVFCFEYENHECKPNERVSFSFGVYTDKEFGLFHYYSHFSGIYFKNISKRGWVKCLIPELCLAPGNYLLMTYTLVSGERADWPQVYLPITVVGADFFGTGNSNLSSWGPILVKGKWFLS